MKTFHQYLYGRYVFVTDHKPLMTILGPKKGIPSLVAARLQRWAILLSTYQYDIKFKPTDAHANADGLSRLPLASSTVEGQSPEASIFNLALLECLPVTETQVQQGVAVHQTRMVCYCPHRFEAVWDQVHGVDSRGWLSAVGSPCDHSQEASWPSLDWTAQQPSRNVLHEGCRTQLCLVAWTRPGHPSHGREFMWTSLAPFLGKCSLSLWMCTQNGPKCSRWVPPPLELPLLFCVGSMQHTDCPSSWCQTMVPSLLSNEFAHFMQANGGKHIWFAQYHPSSNGLAERFVRTFKQAMRAGDQYSTPVHCRLVNFCSVTEPHPMEPLIALQALSS